MLLPVADGDFRSCPAIVRMGSSRHPSGTELTPHTSLASRTKVALAILSTTSMTRNAAAKATYVAA